MIKRCKSCGKKDIKKRFCSLKCYWVFKKKLIGPLSAGWRGGLCSQKKICELCKQVFYGYKTRRFCSKKCHLIWKSRGERNPLWKGGISYNRNEYSKNWLKHHPEYLKLKKINDYARRKGFRKKFIKTKDFKDLLKKYNGKCINCGSEKDLTIDHIIPLSRNGTHEVSNLQVLCRTCNSKKSNRV